MMTDPSCDRLAKIAQETVATLPDPFRALAADVALRVVDWIPDHLIEGDPEAARHEITGLYDGIPVTLKSGFDQPEGPDIVWLFRRPILAELADRPGVSLQELVAHVTIHEFAHHFGWSDDDIAKIDRWWE